MVAARLIFDGVRRAKFLEVLETEVHFGRAARAAGVCSGTVYRVRQRDAAFELAIEEAIRRGTERFMQEKQDAAMDELREAEARGERAWPPKQSNWLVSRLTKLEAAGKRQAAAAGPSKAELQAELLERLAAYGPGGEV